MLEKYIQRQILDYLHLCGVYCWRNNSGNVNISRKDGSTGFMRVGMKGSSDIIGIYKGKFLAIEVKNEKGKLSDMQKSFLEQININGGIGFVARSTNDIDKYLFSLIIE